MRVRCHLVSYIFITFYHPSSWLTDSFARKEEVILKLKLVSAQLDASLFSLSHKSSTRARYVKGIAQFSVRPV